MADYTLIHGDCLDVLPGLPAQSVHAVIADVPYGTTACSWDTVIPFEPMWAGIKHVNKPRGAVVLFGQEPFSSLLRISNMAWFKYDWIWNKGNSGVFASAKYHPLRYHEMISVFSSGQCTYNPIFIDVGKPHNGRGGGLRSLGIGKNKTHERVKYTNKPHENLRYPNSILEYSNGISEVNSNRRLHPTQKPVDLMEYLVKTYTNPGDTVLDFTCGSGSTGVAAVQNGRHFIGIDNGYCEKEGPYYGWRWVDVARERIANAVGDFMLTKKEQENKDGQLFMFNGGAT